MKESLPLRVLIHVLDRVYFTIKGFIYVHFESQGVDSQLSNEEEPFMRSRGSCFFLKTILPGFAKFMHPSIETATPLALGIASDDPGKP